MPKTKNFLQTTKRFFSQEILIALMLMLVNLISVYICCDINMLMRNAVFLFISVCVMMGFYVVKTEVIEKTYRWPMYVLVLVVATIITISKNRENYLFLNETLAFNVSDILLFSTVFSSSLMSTVIRNNENKFIWCIMLILPVMIISAFNSSLTVLVSVFTIAISNLLVWIESQKTTKQTAGIVFFIVIICSIVVMASIIIQANSTNNFAAYFSESNPVDTIDARLISLIYNAGLLFPIFTIGVVFYLCFLMISKAFLLKTDCQKQVVFSTSISIFVHLILSIMLEIFTGHNHGLSTPFLTDASFQIILAMMIGMAVSCTKRVSQQASNAYTIACIRAVFKREKGEKACTSFISYRRETGMDLAMHIYNRLQLKGIRAFLDIETMKSGKFNEQIYQKIDECSNFILVLSKDALNRCGNDEDWVRNEIAYAIKKEKNIILLLTKDFVFPDTLPEDIESIRFYQGIPSTNEFFDYVIEKLVSMLK